MGTCERAEDAAPWEPGKALTQAFGRYSSALIVADGARLALKTPARAVCTR